MALKKYKGAVVQAPLDWYARIAQSAQQWFSSATPAYWAFTLKNNANDGSSLWVYDAAVVSGAAFPASTGNPGGNPNPPAGQSGTSPGTPSTVTIGTTTQSGVNGGNSFVISCPGGVNAGDILILALLGNVAPINMFPPDASWTLLGSNQTSFAGCCLAVYGHVCTASEPASYTCTQNSIPSLYNGQIYPVHGISSPSYFDQFAFNSPQVASGFVNFSGVTNTAAGDLVLCGAANFQSGETFTAPPGFTAMTEINNAVVSYQAFWKGGAALGPIGPFQGQAAHSVIQDTFTLTLKPLVIATAPAQNFSAPIMTQSPVGPGLLTLQFQSSPLGLSGVTKFLPPASNYRWNREAPIAIVGPGLSLNLAGITPENAAWCDMTWIGLRG